MGQNHSCFSIRADLRRATDFDFYDKVLSVNNVFFKITFWVLLLTFSHSEKPIFFILKKFCSRAWLTPLFAPAPITLQVWIETITSEFYAQNNPRNCFISLKMYSLEKNQLGSISQLFVVDKIDLSQLMEYNH